jgi:hypothetical protein
MKEVRYIPVRNLNFILLEGGEGRYQVDILSDESLEDDQYVLGYDYMGFELTEKEVWDNLITDMKDNNDLDLEIIEELETELKKRGLL